ncbi:MAG TPA: IMP dehydrogenase [Anaerolineales bacterium]|nr:IMP dehydrogenase [Anaerolineales bacterium]
MTQASLFDHDIALTFDDVLIVPGYTEVLPDQADTRVSLAQGIQLNIPLLSAAMDTVTTANMAIALAREGGLGVIHRNLSPAQQAAEVDKVKRSEAGMISDPVTLPPSASLQDAENLMATYRISGVPIVSPETHQLLGILTNRDVRFVELNDYHLPVTQFMTSRNLVTAPVGISLEDAKKLLQQHRIEKLPLVDASGRLKGLITVKDIQKQQDFPNSAKDTHGRLLCAAAVGVGADLEERVALLVAENVDCVVIDTAHGHSAGVLRAIQRIRANWQALPIIAGNVVTAEGVTALAEAGANVVKVGVGAGSICTTRVISGAGMPQISAVYACAQAAARLGVTIISDGGVKYSGDIVKALASGAHAVMLGSLLAGLREAPGEEILFEGRLFKQYRGMGSLGALQGYGKDRYASGQGTQGKLVPEGVEGMVPFKGEVREFIFQLVGGIRSGMGYAGAGTLAELRTGTRFVRITAAGLLESHPHTVQITREAPNYQAR